MSSSPTRLPGRATRGGTRAFTARAGLPKGAARDFGGLSLGSVGLGTYLGEADDETDALYAEAVARALDAGMNVLDTAISYRAQRSERVIGRALAEAIASGRVRREEIVIASKAGYVPFDGGRPRHYPTYVEETYLRPGILAREDLVNGVHCMTPRYLDDQIERSRANLGLETIDIYYLHNPESGMDGVPPEVFRPRLSAAFATLEAAACDGRIGCWGTATWNGFRKPPGQSPHHSLSEFIEIARAVGGEHHHFRVVQLPYNLAYIEAFAAQTQELNGRLASLLDCAAAHGVYVMTSAPLLQGQLAERLPEELRAALGFDSDAQRAIQFARSTPGVGTALIGAQRTAHVDAAAAVGRAAPVPADAIAGLFNEDSPPL